MANNLEENILDYFPNENNKVEEAIMDGIPENFVLLGKYNYSQQFKLVIGQLEFHAIPFKLEKGVELVGITSFYIYVHKDNEQRAIDLLQNLQPDIVYQKDPKWKPEKMQRTIFYIIVVTILLVLVLFLISMS